MFQFKLTILCLLLLLNAGCIRFVKPQSESGREPASADKIVTHHKVMPGETLYSIAFEYGRDHRDVARWNNIPKPYTIFPKQRLRVIPIADDEKKIRKKRKLVTATRSSRKTVTAVNKQGSYSGKLKWGWPTNGEVVSTFSYSDPGRRGIDIVGTKGQPVYAAAAGIVVYKGSGLRGYGNLVIVQHNDTYFSAYAHTDGVVVKEDEKVKLGQKLADMSDTGSEKIQLHFEIRRNGKPVNPLKYLPTRR